MTNDSDLIVFDAEAADDSSEKDSSDKDEQKDSDGELKIHNRTSVSHFYTS